MANAPNDPKNAAPDSLRDALVLAAAIAVVNGFARFAYALLLPPMRADLGWDYALSGWLNTANSIGYGLGALLGVVLAAQFRPALLFRWGLITTLFTLLFCGLTHSLWWMMLWRFLSGVGSAWVFACGGAMVAQRYADNPARAGAAIALLYAGGGIGMSLSGPMLMPVLQGAWPWSWGWIALAGVGCAFALAPLRVMARLDRALPQQTSAHDASQSLGWQSFWRMLMAYFLFGVGYIVYLTFVVAWMREMRLDVPQTVGVWVFLGGVVFASGWVWRKAMASWWPGHTFAAAACVVAAGTVLPLLAQTLPMLLLSALLVGSFFMIPGSVVAFSRNWLPQPLWSKAMNLFTLLFAAGQAVGPIVAGELGDRLGLNWAMVFGASTLLVGAGLALLQPRKP